MTTFTNIFGGGVITPSENSYTKIEMTTDTVLSWKPTTGKVLSASIMDVSCSTSSKSITLGETSEVSEGTNLVFNNVGLNNITLKDSEDTTICTLTAGTVWLVYLSTNGLWLSFQYGAGTVNVNTTLLASYGLKASGSSLQTDCVVLSKNSDYVMSVNDKTKLVLWSGTGSATITLPSAISNSGFYVYIKNSGDSAITIATAGGNIGTTSTLTMSVTQSGLFISDGANFHVVSLTSTTSAVSDMSPTSIDITGSGDYTLPSNLYDKIVYKLYGTISADRTVIVPSTVQEYWVENTTTGAYKVYLKMTGTDKIPLEIVQGQRGIFFCNGVNILYGDTRSVDAIVAVDSGGTGATTAGAALTNLGGGSTGIQVFESTDTADVVGALGWSTTTGDLLVGTSGGSLEVLLMGNTGQFLVSGTNSLEWNDILSESHGGTGYNTYNTGDLLVGTSSSDLVTLAIGSANTVLTSNGNSLSWGSTDSSITGPIPVNKGGTGLATHGKGKILVGNSANGLSSITAGTTGQVLKANSSLANGIEWGNPKGIAYDSTTIKLYNNDSTVSGYVDGILLGDNARCPLVLSVNTGRNKTEYSGYYTENSIGTNSLTTVNLFYLSGGVITTLPTLSNDVSQMFPISNRVGPDVYYVGVLLLKMTVFMYYKLANGNRHIKLYTKRYHAYKTSTSAATLAAITDAGDSVLSSETTVIPAPTLTANIIESVGVDAVAYLVPRVTFTIASNNTIDYQTSAYFEVLHDYGE
jgi:hypothetical protein